MRKQLLKLVRKLNKALYCSKIGSLKIQRYFKDKKVYNYLEVPEKCFKSVSCKSIVRY